MTPLSIVHRPHKHNLVAWAKDRREVLVLSADLTGSCEADGFREAYGERFFSMGMAEQNMMGFAAGLAREGFVPLVHTFAVFICRRAFDQVAMAIGYPNLRVRLLGFLPGVTTPGGVTHQAIDDLALMRAIPNMTVLECGDATDVETVLDVAHDIPGPVYVRMLRGEVPRLFPSREPMKLGELRLPCEGPDLVVLSSGVCTQEAIQAVRAAAGRGLFATVAHVSTLKPFDAHHVADLVANARLGAISLENHSIVGGLGTCAAETMAEHGIGKRLIRCGLNDTYAHGASRPYLMAKYGLDARAVVTAMETLAGEELQITDGDLELHRGRAATPERSLL